MNTPSNAVPETPATMSPTRPLYWSIRRELWENRSIYIAPLVVAAVFLLAILISIVHLPERRRATLLLDPAHQQAAIEKPYDIAAILLILTAFLVGVFYCLDALHGERRDRSILFWKSLPVSDRTTVLAKAGVPMVILPLFVLVIAVAAQLVVLFCSTVVLMGNDAGLAVVWRNVKFIQSALALLYGV